MLSTVNWFDLLNLGIAYVIAMPIGFEREREEHSTGIRTFPLMAVASCCSVLIGRRVMSLDGQARVLQGLFSGIGLLCAGAIIQDRKRVHGTATAASLFGTAAIGAAIAYQIYDLAIMMSILIFVTLHLFRKSQERRR
jgi:putative Mg2+ transporter-C (MgtC) family protein